MLRTATAKQLKQVISGIKLEIAQCSRDVQDLRHAARELSELREDDINPRRDLDNERRAGLQQLNDALDAVPDDVMTEAQKASYRASLSKLWKEDAAVVDTCERFTKDVISGEIEAANVEMQTLGMSGSSGVGQWWLCGSAGGNVDDAVEILRLQEISRHRSGAAGDEKSVSKKLSEKRKKLERELRKVKYQRRVLLSALGVSDSDDGSESDETETDSDDVSGSDDEDDDVDSDDDDDSSDEDEETSSEEDDDDDDDGNRLPMYTPAAPMIAASKLSPPPPKSGGRRELVLDFSLPADLTDTTESAQFDSSLRKERLLMKLVTQMRHATQRGVPVLRITNTPDGRTVTIKQQFMYLRNTVLADGRTSSAKIYFSASEEMRHRAVEAVSMVEFVDWRLGLRDEVLSGKAPSFPLAPWESQPTSPDLAPAKLCDVYHRSFTFQRRATEKHDGYFNIVFMSDADFETWVFELSRRAGEPPAWLHSITRDEMAKHSTVEMSDRDITACCRLHCTPEQLDRAKAVAQKPGRLYLTLSDIRRASGLQVAFARVILQYIASLGLVEAVFVTYNPEQQRMQRIRAKKENEPAEMQELRDELWDLYREHERALEGQGSVECQTPGSQCTCDMCLLEHLKEIMHALTTYDHEDGIVFLTSVAKRINNNKKFTTKAAALAIVALHRLLRTGDIPAFYNAKLEAIKAYTIASSTHDLVHKFAAECFPTLSSSKSSSSSAHASLESMMKMAAAGKLAEDSEMDNQETSIEKKSGVFYLTIPLHDAVVAGQQIQLPENHTLGSLVDADFTFSFQQYLDLEKEVRARTAYVMAIDPERGDAGGICGESVRELPTFFQEWHCENGIAAHGSNVLVLKDKQLQVVSDLTKCCTRLSTPGFRSPTGKSETVDGAYRIVVVSKLEWVWGYFAAPMQIIIRKVGSSKSLSVSFSPRGIGQSTSTELPLTGAGSFVPWDASTHGAYVSIMSAASPKKKPFKLPPKFLSVLFASGLPLLATAVRALWLELCRGGQRAPFYVSYRDIVESGRTLREHLAHLGLPDAIITTAKLVCFIDEFDPEIARSTLTPDTTLWDKLALAELPACHVVLCCTNEQMLAQASLTTASLAAHCVTMYVRGSGAVRTNTNNNAGSPMKPPINIDETVVDGGASREASESDFSEPELEHEIHAMAPTSPRAAGGGGLPAPTASSPSTTAIDREDIAPVVLPQGAMISKAGGFLKLGTTTRWLELCSSDPSVAIYSESCGGKEVGRLDLSKLENATTPQPSALCLRGTGINPAKPSKAVYELMFSSASDCRKWHVYCGHFIKKA
eukprot:PhM_4_TR15263/c1_g1_i1/m.55796